MTKKQRGKRDLVGCAAILGAVAAIITAGRGCISDLLDKRSTIFPPAPGPTPTAVVIDSMSNLSSWTVYTDTVGSTIHLGLAPDAQDPSLEIVFDLKQYGYVGIAKYINSHRLAQANGIRFFYRGSGAPNTIELKLIYESGTVFSVPWHSITAQDQRKSLEALYGDFKCWPDTGPRDVNNPDYCPENKGLQLDVKKVARLDFAISNKPEHGGQPGSGRVVIDNVIGTQ